jgi:hypothetical protein
MQTSFTAWSQDDPPGDGPISADLSPDPGSDQRRQRRVRVLLQASIFPIDSIDDVTVHNISEQGLMAEADVDLTVGQVVHLSFDGTSHRSGIVRWIRGRRFGLHVEDCFGTPGALDEIEPETDAGHQSRSMRLSLNIPARMSSGRPRRPAMVRNLSRSGMSLETSAGLRVGQNLLIKIGRQPPIPARIRWTAAGRIGVSVDGDQMVPLIGAQDVFQQR